MPFYTLTNLQGSQTFPPNNAGEYKFYTLTNLQGSQTERLLKRKVRSFTLLQTYKVLKPDTTPFNSAGVLHSYKLTRFSNPASGRSANSWFYTLTNLQGSQTPCAVPDVICCFTLLQTYKVLKPP